MLQPSKRPNGATFSCLDDWSHWWRRSKRAQRHHGTAKRVRLGLRSGMSLLTGNWHSPPAAFFLQAHIIALISLSPAHQGGPRPVPTPFPLADDTRPPPCAPHNATGTEAAAGTPPELSTRQHRGVAAGAEEGVRRRHAVFLRGAAKGRPPFRWPLRRISTREGERGTEHGKACCLEVAQERGSRVGWGEGEGGGKASRFFPRWQPLLLAAAQVAAL